MGQLLVTNKKTGEVRNLNTEEVSSVRNEVIRNGLNIMIINANDGESYTPVVTIEQFTKVASEDFMTVDRGEVVNLTNVKLFDKETSEVILNNDQRVYVSKTKVSELLQRLNNKE